jgi:hypothetical protein
MEALTSENATPHLMATSKALSFGPFIIGEYSFNNPSSLWSVERRESAYANISSRLEMGLAKRRTVAVVENCNFREQRCFPTTTTSAFLYQIYKDMGGFTTDQSP